MARSAERPFGLRYRLRKIGADLSEMNSTIHVVDDDPSFRRAVSRLLRASGFRVETYATAADFLRESPAEGPGCVLTDLQMPGISGIELRRRLAAVGETTPVIFITAHDEPQMRVEAESIGCAGYFPKTAPGSDVLDAIRRAAQNE